MKAKLSSALVLLEKTVAIASVAVPALRQIATILGVIEMEAE